MPDEVSQEVVVRVGDKVVWHPPEARLFTFGGLTPEHPGTAAHVGPKHVQVEWVAVKEPTRAMAYTPPSCCAS